MGWERGAGDHSIGSKIPGVQGGQSRFKHGVLYQHIRGGVLDDSGGWERGMLQGSLCKDDAGRLSDTPIGAVEGRSLGADMILLEGFRLTTSDGWE